MGTVSKRIDTPYGGFYPLGTPSSALLEIPRRTERKRSYLCSGPKKGTAVPLPIHRPQSAIPFTTALGPLALCDSIYAKPVQSAVITPRQCRKRKPIPFLYASYLRSRAVRPVREVAPKGKGEIHKRGGNRRCLSLLCARRAQRHVPALRRARNPRSERVQRCAPRVHRVTAAEEQAAARSRRIAHAPCVPCFCAAAQKNAPFLAKERQNKDCGDKDMNGAWRLSQPP